MRVGSMMMVVVVVVMVVMLISIQARAGDESDEQIGRADGRK